MIRKKMKTKKMENNLFLKYHNRHRSSSNRRLSVNKQNNNTVETDSDTENKGDSNSATVVRRNSNTSRSSKRSRRYHRSSSRGSNRNLNLDGNQKNGDLSRTARSRKRF